MCWAITSYGVGNKVGWRFINEDWPLEGNEIFKTTEDFDENKVLAADEVSLELPS